MRRYVGSCGLVAALALLMAALSQAAVGAADEPPSVIVVFDGSGSMWGTIEGTRANKLTVARDALRRGLAKVGPQSRIGLASFGHRRGDCGDVEVMLPPEPLDVERVMGPLDKLNPRGKGPLTLALKEAAKSLTSSPGKSSLLLIHDDADNCQPNLCAVATELRAAGVTVHVVGLALKAEDANKMLCLPQTTGGRMFNPQTSDQVDAAVEVALRVASIGGEAAPPPPTPPRPTVSSPAPSVPQDAPAGLYLRALLAPKTEPLGWPLHWIVFREGMPASVLFDGRASNPHVPAPAGRYVVEARDGAVSARAAVDVAERGPTLVNLVLNGGTLHVRGQAQKSGVPMDDAIITISGAGQGTTDAKKDAAGPPLAVFKGSEGIATLPAGRYVVRVEQGLVRTERSIVVPAGSQGRIDVPLNGALLQVTATGRDGDPLDAPIFSVFEDDPDAPRGRREIARSAARQSEFLLPPGTYYVNVRQGGAEAQERVAVGPGDVVRRTLSLAAGRLSLSTRPLGGTQTLTAPLSYRVDRIDGALPDLLTTSRSSPELYLPAGRYRVEGRYGIMNARLVREVEVRAGQTQSVSFEHQASTLKLRLLGTSGIPVGEVFWDVRDQSGRTVWTTGQSEPYVTLQAGRYQIRAETRDKRYERALDLAAGEVKPFEITAD